MVEVSSCEDSNLVLTDFGDVYKWRTLNAPATIPTIATAAHHHSSTSCGGGAGSQSDADETVTATGREDSSSLDLSPPLLQSPKPTMKRLVVPMHTARIYKD